MQEFPFEEGLTSIEAARSTEQLEVARLAVVGRKGWLTQAMRNLRTQPPKERRLLGEKLNVYKKQVERLLLGHKRLLAQDAIRGTLASERQDLTLPAREMSCGHLHPIGQTLERALEILGHMGFRAVAGPHVEDDFHNFTALNIPPDHPARQSQDTFYLSRIDEAGMPMLLRTHTSAAQVRTMRTNSPPLRVVSAGRVFRADHDATHAPMFHQIEGLVVDKCSTFAHLKGMLIAFCEAFFKHKEVPLRFRPSYFPFTEPSAEVDIGCVRAGDKLRIGSGGKWLEVLGCGMVHPRVLGNGGVDSRIWQGFAFGMGVERLAMLQHGIPDLRSFFAGEQSWIRHYGIAPLTMSSLLQGGEAQ